MNKIKHSLPTLKLMINYKIKGFLSILNQDFIKEVLMKNRIIKFCVPCFMALILAPLTTNLLNIGNMGTSFLIGMGFGFAGVLIGIFWGFGDSIMEIFK